MRNGALERLSVTVWLALCAATCLSAPLQSAAAVTGTWTLVSSVTDRDGKKSDQFGTGAKGMMSLDAQGHFMLTIVGADLPKFASGNRASATPEESRMVVAGSIAMMGTYFVDATNKTLTFHVEAATFPNWNGTTQNRLIVTANGDELKYVTPTASSGGVGTVTWKRADR
jgi:polyisoprenoid-binding protein YceI